MSLTLEKDSRILKEIEERSSVQQVLSFLSGLRLLEYKSRLQLTLEENSEILLEEI